MKLGIPVLLLAATLAAQSPAGMPTPPGGTVRSLVADPFHAGALELGTTSGTLFRTVDAGASWAFQSRIVNQDWVVATLAADPTTPGRWYAGLWGFSPSEGGVFLSQDGGRSWQAALSGHEVRAIAIAPSDARVVVAATLDGVFRSSDRGATWERISPAWNRELRDVESVAIDPQDPQEIYIGTWHLPWKTINGGHDWLQLDKGIIDDSDVFSIAIDPKHRDTVYLSACSGIYRSDDRGNQFRKIQGIPLTARRTHALVPDPADPGTVYAGTTEGLWTTHDGGATWQRATADNVSVNVVALAPTGAGGRRLLLGNEHLGVLASDDGGRSFAAANAGFSNRLIAAVTETPEARYVAVAGDDLWGGVFEQRDGAWKDLGAPQRDMDISALAVAGGAVLAGSERGVFRYENGAWHAVKGVPASRIGGLASAPVASATVLAASTLGLYRSDDAGLTWRRLPEAPAPVDRVLATPGWLYIAAAGVVLRSPDLGLHFVAGSLSDSGHVAAIGSAALPGEPTDPVVFAATDRGLYASWDAGAHWELCGHGLPQQPMRSIQIAGATIYASGAQLGALYRSTDGGHHWTPAVVAPFQLDLARMAPGAMP